MGGGGGGVVSIITKWREKNIKTVRSIFFYFLNSLKTQNIIYTIIFGAMHILYIVIISGVQYRLISAKNIYNYYFLPYVGDSMNMHDINTHDKP